MLIHLTAYTGDRVVMDNAQHNLPDPKLTSSNSLKPLRMTFSMTQNKGKQILTLACELKQNELNVGLTDSS